MIAGLEVKVMEYSDVSDGDKDQMFKLRKEAFIDRRGWDIETYGGGREESDQYDDHNSTYIILKHGEFVSGCVRIRPSFKSNLTGRYFGWMRKKSLNDSIGRDGGLIWEASRFALREVPNCEPIRVRGVDIRTVMIFREMIRVAKESGVQHYEVVVDSLMRKILQRAKWDLVIVSEGRGSQGENVFYGLLSCSDIQYDKLHKLLAGKVCMMDDG